MSEKSHPTTTPPRAPRRSRLTLRAAALLLVAAMLSVLLVSAADARCCSPPIPIDGAGESRAAAGTGDVPMSAQFQYGGWSGWGVIEKELRPVSDAVVTVTESVDAANEWVQSHLESIHLGLDIVGVVPVIGEVADLANGAIYMMEGDYGNATWSVVAIIPVAGGAVIAVKAAKRIPITPQMKKLADEGDMRTLTRKFLDDSTKLYRGKSKVFEDMDKEVKFLRLPHTIRTALPKVYKNGNLVEVDKFGKELDEIVFSTDEYGRTIKASTTLSPFDGRTTQAPKTIKAIRDGMANAATKQGLDKGQYNTGHLIGRQFGGPYDHPLNYIPQLSARNTEMSGLENGIAKRMRLTGERPEVEIKLVYEGDSVVPSELIYRYKFPDEAWQSKTFPNMSNGRSTGTLPAGLVAGGSTAAAATASSGSGSASGSDSSTVPRVFYEHIDPVPNLYDYSGKYTWWRPPSWIEQYGFDGEFWFTLAHASGTTVDNRAVWHLTAWKGRQVIEAYIPEAWSTAHVGYTLAIDGQIHSTAWLDQSAKKGWQPLWSGTFNNAALTVTVDDIVTRDDHLFADNSEVRIAVSAMRIRTVDE